MKSLAIVGGFLLLISSWHLFLEAREIVVGRAAVARYELKEVYDALRLDYAGQSIVLKDAFAGSDFKQEDRRQGPATILINGRDYSIPSEVKIRPFYRDANRYHGWVCLYRLVDQRKNET